jgi:hypothetical protein
MLAALRAAAPWLAVLAPGAEPPDPHGWWYRLAGFVRVGGWPSVPGPPRLVVPVGWFVRAGGWWPSVPGPPRLVVLVGWLCAGWWVVAVCPPAPAIGGTGLLGPWVTGCSLQ